MKTTIKDIKRGEWFTLKDIENPTEMQVWIKDEYDRTEKAYWCQCFGDINKFRLFKGNKEVYTEFTF